jgi:dUTP pyrophosphatase
MKFKVKKLHDNVQLPKYAHDGDAAFDVYSREDKTLAPGERYTFKLGFAAEFDLGFVCLVWDRSGLAAKQGVHALAGVIDASYRGEYGVVLLNTSNAPVEINNRDRIAQMLIQPVERVSIEATNELSNSERGSGWGSSGA